MITPANFAAAVGLLNSNGGGASLPLLNSLDVGAVGDGVTDDHDALQGALNTIGEAGGGTLFIPQPEVEYICGSALQFWANTIVICEPGAKIRRTGSGSLVRNYDGVTETPGYTGPGNIWMIGGIWDGGAADGNTHPGATVSFAHCQGIHIEKCIFQNVIDTHGVELNACRKAVIRDCVGQGFKTVNTGRYISEAFQLDGAISTATLQAPPYDDTFCDDILIEGCTTRPLGDLGAFGRLAGSHSAADGFFHTNIRIIGNHAYNTLDYAVRMYSWRGAVVSGNTFENCNGAVKYEVAPATVSIPMFDCVIVNNACRNMGQLNANANNADNPTQPLYACISVNGGTSPATAQDVVIANNNIRDFDNYGAAIMAANCSRLLVTGNNVFGTGTGTTADGIQINGCAAAVIDANRVTNMKEYGIYLYGSSSQGSVSNNVIASTDNDCIRIDTSNSQVNNNFITAPGSGHVGINFTGSIIYASCKNNTIRENGAGGANGIVAATSAVTNLHCVANHITGWGSSTTVGSAAPFGGNSSSYNPAPASGLHALYN